MGKLLQGGNIQQRNKHKLTIKHEAISNRDLIILPETLVIKSIHNDIHCVVVATQKKDKIKSMMAGIFTRFRRIYKREQKCKELRNSTQTTLHS